MTNLLLLAYRREPASLPLVASMIITRHREKADIDLAKVGDFIAANIGRLISTRAFGELCWILSLCNALKLQVSTSAVEGMFLENEPLIALSLCHLEQNGLIKIVDKKAWNTHATRDGLTSSMWLYAYEAALKKWNGLASDAYVTGDQYFSELYVRKVSFYDIDAEIRDIGSLRRRDLAASRIQRAVLEDYFEDLEFDIDDVDDEFEDWEDDEY